LRPRRQFEAAAKAIPENDVMMKFDLNLSAGAVSPVFASAC
jgi:hypothetical protein